MISLYDLLEAANGQLFGEPNAQLFTGFCLDSRIAQENQIFVARKTDYGDTHQYIGEAIRRGATGILCTRPPDVDTTGISVIIVKDTETSMMNWASYVLDKLGPQVIGVTGSYGKSVTTEAIRRVLSVRYQVHNSGGELRGRLRLPLALAGLKAEHEMVVLELGAWQEGEIAEMVGVTRPDAAVVTHIGYSHTDSFGDLDQIAQEEGLLVEHLSASGLAVLNYDDDRIRNMAARTEAQVMQVGCNFGADLMAYNIVESQTKTGFDMRHGPERYVGRWTPLLSKHHLYSVLFALAVGLHYDVPLEQGLQALTEMNPLPGRMNPLRGLNDCLLVDDTYDATPESTEAALEWLNAIRDGSDRRVIFVMGDMDHLGAYTQRGHRMVGPSAAEVADVIVTEGSQAAVVARAAIDHGKERRSVRLTYNAQDTVTVLRDQVGLREGDVVLIKGAAAARMEQVVKPLLADEADMAQLVRQGDVWEAESTAQPASTTWVEIDQGAIAHNVRLIKQGLEDHVKLMAVVKADAYGHGAVASSITALANGAELLGVASLDEALELRDAGIDAPILVLSYTPVYAVRQAIRQKITLTLYDLDMAIAYNRAAREVGELLRVHIKVDTGMGRLGVLPSAAVPFFRHLINLQQLEIEGIYTHFSMADEDPDYTLEQLRVFKSVVNPLRASGFQFRYIHAANSAATLTLKETHLDMVRVGVALYGESPSDTVPIPPEYQTAITWKTVIAQVKTLPAGHPVGYGQTYYTSSQERIAVIPIGYSHGFRRKPHNWGRVLVHGQFAPILGRVSMEKTTIDVSHIPDVAIGDEVVVLGQQGDNAITPNDVAARLGTNNYEVITTILARVPRR
ncbi:MAG: alanine racemase [Anaerolineaceae bacterium]|nr:alanine racemase [Anaerolineaceae bacterium]